jgi:hypothetical protein
MRIVVCPLCGNRRARRGCPALGQQICAICCGTKRLTEIDCPADCVWLASAREHPPAVAVRQQQRDLSLLMPVLRDFTPRQSELLFLIATFLLRYEPPELQRLIDADVAEGMGALASTLETASRGVIYEHRPPSLAAERLTAALKPALTDAGRGFGSAFERDAAVVMRRVVDLVKDAGAQEPDNRRAFLEMLRRVVARTTPADDQHEGAKEGRPAAPPLIVP